MSAPALAAGAPAAAATGAWHARLDLGFRRDGARTVLATRAHAGPLRVQKALYPEGPERCHAVIVHPPGGIAGGDQLSIAVTAAAGAQALITTPGAAKWYKAQRGAALQDVRLAVAPGAALEWLPQEAIVFNAAHAEARLRVDLAGDARFIGWDILCFGRTAAAERFASGRYRQCWEIRRDGAPLWTEVGTVEGGGDAMQAPTGLAGQPVCATLVACAPAMPSAWLDALRAVLAGLRCAPRVAATHLGPVIAVRYLGPSTEEARTALEPAWGKLRALLLGAGAEPPRLWRT